jgi:hypothetical protein
VAASVALVQFMKRIRRKGLDAGRLDERTLGGIFALLRDKKITREGVYALMEKAARGEALPAAGALPPAPSGEEIEAEVGRSLRPARRDDPSQSRKEGPRPDGPGHAGPARPGRGRRGRAARRGGGCGEKLMAGDDPTRATGARPWPCSKASGPWSGATSRSRPPAGPTRASSCRARKRPIPITSSSSSARATTSASWPGPSRP